MPPVKYQIYQLSARSVLGYAREQDRAYTFALDAAETKKCVSLASEQDDNALFYQIMCVLHGDDFAVPKNQLSPFEAFLLLFLTKFPIHDRICTQTYTLDRVNKMYPNYTHALFCIGVQKGVCDCMVLLVSERNDGKGQCCFDCGKQAVFMVDTEL